ncbi:MAG: cell division protein FtsW, partial [Psychromonas sp.]|nr:cell division protein FtsW [Psychromonas sp.]
MKLLNKLKSFFKRPEVSQAYDRQLLVVVFILMSVGLVIVTSASMPEGVVLSADPFRFLKRHLLYLVLCLGFIGGVVCVPTQQWYD